MVANAHPGGAERPPYHLAIEIGGTKQQAAVGTADGQILARRQVRLAGGTTAKGIRSWIETTVRGLQADWDLSGIGVGFGGPIDPPTGRILCSLQVEGWEDFPLRDWFHDTFRLPTVVRNDTVTGGLGELYRGAGRGSRRFFYTNIGTGIGGGLYWPGGFGASSLGYAWVPDWRAAAPGAATRLEYLCAGPSIEKRLNSPGYVPPASYLAARPLPHTCADLADGVRLGDAFCCEELDRVAQTFSLGLADVLALAFPDTIVIGGGVAKMGDILFSRLRKATEAAAFVADVGRIRILPSQLMDDAVLVGALLLSADPALSEMG